MKKNILQQAKEKKNQKPTLRTGRRKRQVVRCGYKERQTDTAYMRVIPASQPVERRRSAGVFPLPACESHTRPGCRARIGLTGRRRRQSEWRDRPAAMHDFIDRSRGHSDGARHGVLRNPHGFEVLLKQNPTGCDWCVHAYMKRKFSGRQRKRRTENLVYGRVKGKDKSLHVQVFHGDGSCFHDE